MRWILGSLPPLWGIILATISQGRVVNTLKPKRFSIDPRSSKEAEGCLWSRTPNPQAPASHFGQACAKAHIKTKDEVDKLLALQREYLPHENYKVANTMLPSFIPAIISRDIELKAGDIGVDEDENPQPLQ